MTVTRSTPADELPELLDVTQAATWLGVGRGLVYTLVQRRELQAVKLGRLLRIPKQALLDFAHGSEMAPQQGQLRTVRRTGR